VRRTRAEAFWCGAPPSAAASELPTARMPLFYRMIGGPHGGLEAFGEVVDAGHVVHSDEEGLVARGLEEHRRRDHGRHVVDVREGPRLEPVAEYGDGLLAHDLVDKDANRVPELVREVLTQFAPFPGVGGG